MQSLSNYIKGGKQINEFLVKGKFDAQKSHNSIIYWPKFNKLAKDKYEFVKWEELKVKGTGKYVIYEDMYHRNKLHIADVGDMIGMYGSVIGVNDFEDFDEKNIYGRYETLKEAVIALCKYNKLTDSEIKNIEDSEDRGDVYKLLKQAEKGAYDSDTFIWQVLTGQIKDDDYENWVGDGDPKTHKDYADYFNESAMHIIITNDTEMYK